MNFYWLISFKLIEEEIKVVFFLLVILLKLLIKYGELVIILSDVLIK